MKIEYLLTDKSMKVPPNYIKVRIKKIGCFYFGIENDDDEKYRDICLLISTIHKSCAIFSMLLISQNPDKQESNMPSGIFFDTDFYYIDLYLYYASN